MCPLNALSRPARLLDLAHLRDARRDHLPEIRRAFGQSDGAQAGPRTHPRA